MAISILVFRHFCCGEFDYEQILADTQENVDKCVNKAKSFVGINSDWTHKVSRRELGEDGVFHSKEVLFDSTK